MTLYRFEDVQFAGMPCDDPGGGENFGRSTLQAVCYECVVTKETPKGFWISGKRWVSKTGKKRYAHPTKEEAWKSFKKRKERQIEIYSARLDRARRASELQMP